VRADDALTEVDRTRALTRSAQRVLKQHPRFAQHDKLPDSTGRKGEVGTRSFLTEHEDRVYSHGSVGRPATSKKADHQNNTGNRAER
jgi:hypothetical protein